MQAATGETEAQKCAKLEHFGSLDIHWTIWKKLQNPKIVVKPPEVQGPISKILGQKGL